MAPPEGPCAALWPPRTEPVPSFVLARARCIVAAGSPAVNYCDNSGLGKNLTSAASNDTRPREAPPRIKYIRPWLTLLPHMFLIRMLALCVLRFCRVVTAVYSRSTRLYVRTREHPSILSFCDLVCSSLLHTRSMEECLCAVSMGGRELAVMMAPAP